MATKPQQPGDRGRTVVGRVTGAVGGVFSAAVGTVEALGHHVVRLPGLGRPEQVATRAAPGQRPGIEHVPGVDTPPEMGAVHVTCLDYSADRIESQRVEDLAAFLQTDRPEWATVRWINVDGLHPYVIDQFRQSFGIHTLAAEDMLHVPQRPKAEPYEKDLFLVVRMPRLIDGEFIAEQISFFLRPGLLITFQERPGDVWEPIRERLKITSSRLRNRKAGYLTYTLLDAVVDHCFPLLECYGDTLEELESVVVEHPTPELLKRIHVIKRELVSLRRVMWPMREVLDFLNRGEHEAFSQFTRQYLRDVYDHTVQVIEIIETYREMSGGLTDLYMSAVSNRMNEVMKVLTIMATLFIPITFIAGVYGMNFEHIPELKWPWAYFAFWGTCVVVVSVLVFSFWRRGWIGRSP
ncbi:MAG: magnesium/cobalt transporter CorA [Phycisphaerae bacterium]|nr:magnesium/cobalt transporter CorA [Phycisphaerae bacterium]